MHETDNAFRAMTNGEWYFDSAVTIQKRDATRIALQKSGQILDNDARMATIQKLLGHTGSDFSSKPVLNLASVKTLRLAIIFTPIVTSLFVTKHQSPLVTTVNLAQEYHS